MAKIDVHDALVGNLLSWGLVHPADGSEGHAWVLDEAVQARLSQLASRSGTWLAEELVYLDHRCGGCGERRLTRLVEGQYLCNGCREAARSGGVIAGA